MLDTVLGSKQEAVVREEGRVEPRMAGVEAGSLEPVLLGEGG